MEIIRRLQLRPYILFVFVCLLKARKLKITMGTTSFQSRRPNLLFHYFFGSHQNVISIIDLNKINAFWNRLT